MGVDTLESGTHRLVSQAALTVYGAITLLGIVEAATLKNVADTAASLVIVIITGSVSIVIAHAWAHVVAHRLIRGRTSTRTEVIDELWFAASFLIPAVVAILAILASLAAGDFAVTVATVQIVLLAFLFVIGVVGARRSGTGWLRSILWGVVDVGVGLLIVLLKDLLSLSAYL